MTISFDYEQLNMSVGLTEINTAQYVNSLWGSGDFFRSNGVDNMLDLESSVIVPADGVNQTVTFWAMFPSGGSGTRVVLGQSEFISPNLQPGFILNLLTGGQLNPVFYQNATNFLQMTTSVTVDDDILHHYAIVVKGATDELEVYRDGISISVTPVTSGTGYSTSMTNERDLRFGGRITNGSPSQVLTNLTTFGRNKIARADAGSAAEVLEEYNAELAAQISPLSLTTPTGLITLGDYISVVDGFGDSGI